MPTTEFADLAELPRPERPSRNGHDERLPSIKAIVGGESRAPKPGRSVEPRDSAGFPGFTAEKRPYGRDRQFIESLEAIADFDPQASQAVNNFLRLMNPGHEVKVLIGPAGRTTKRPSGAGQALVDSWIDRVAGEYGGGQDIFHNVLSLMLVIHGAIASEIAPLQDLSGLEDWYPINPLRLDFKRFPVFTGDEIGKLMLCQRTKDGKTRLVNPEQVFYFGLDPVVDKPYGRPPLMAALATVLSKSVMLNDLRAVAHNQGYPRIDVKILWESLAKAAPPSLRDGGRDKDLVDWMKRQLDSIAADYNTLNVDDTFIHYDWVDIGMVGPNYAASSFDFKGLEQILTRQINSALKTLPILLGYNEAVSETHGSIQWQIQMDTIVSLRKLVKRLLEKLWNATLRLYGIDAHATIDYKPVRTVDRKFEAQSALLEAQTLQVYQTMGWASGDEIAQELFGHDAVAEPVLPGAAAKGDTSSTNDGTSQKGDQTKSVREVVEDLLADREPLELEGYDFDALEDRLAGRMESFDRRLERVADVGRELSEEMLRAVVAVASREVRVDAPVTISEGAVRVEVAPAAVEVHPAAVEVHPAAVDVHLPEARSRRVVRETTFMKDEHGDLAGKTEVEVTDGE